MSSYQELRKLLDDYYQFYTHINQLQDLPSCQSCLVYQKYLNSLQIQVSPDTMFKQLSQLQGKIQALNQLTQRQIVVDKPSNQLQLEINKTENQNFLLRKKISKLDNEILRTQQNIQQLELDQDIQKQFQHKNSELQKIQIQRLKKLIKPLNSSYSLDQVKNISQSSSFEFQKMLNTNKKENITVQDVNFDIEF